MANVSHLFHKHTDLVQFKKVLGQIWPHVQNIIFLCLQSGLKQSSGLGQHDAITALEAQLSDITLYVQFFRDLCSCVYPTFYYYSG